MTEAELILSKIKNEYQFNWVFEYLEKESIDAITPPDKANHANPIGFYVYALINPFSRKIFYIGKGLNRRAYSHLNLSDKNPNKAKNESVKNIYINGSSPIIWILSQGLSEGEALDMEAILINIIKGLTNISIPSIKDNNTYFKRAKIEYTVAKDVRKVPRRDIKKLSMEEMVDNMITVVCNGKLINHGTWLYSYNKHLYSFVNVIHLLPTHLLKEVRTKSYLRRSKSVSYF